MLFYVSASYLLFYDAILVRKLKCDCPRRMEINMVDDFEVFQTSTKDTVKKISKLILDDIAPEEVVLVDTLVESYFSQEGVSDSTILESPVKDSQLGFAGQSDLLVTILIPVIVAGISKIFGKFTDSTYEQLKTALSSKTKKKSTKQIFKLEAHVDTVRKELVIKVTEKNMTKKKAEKLVDRILELVIQEMVTK